MLVVRYFLFKILLGSIFILSTYSHTLFAQEKLEKTVDVLYKLEDKMKAMYVLEYMFSQEFIDKTFSHSLKNNKHTDSIRKDIAQYLHKRANASPNLSINNLIYSKLGSEYIKKKDNVIGFSYLKMVEKDKINQNPHNLYYFYFNKYESFVYLRRKDSLMHYAKYMTQVAQKINNDSLKNELFLLLGSAFFRNSLYKESRQHFLMAIKYYEKIPDLKRRNISHINTVATSFRNEKHYDSTFFYYQDALNLAYQYQDSAWIGLINGNIGYTHLLQKEYPKAIPYLLKELSINARHTKKGKKLNNSTILCVTNLADAYLNLGDLQNATLYLDSARNNLDAKNWNWSVLRDFYKISANVSAQKGNYKEAFEFYEKYHSASDSTNLQEMTKKAQEINAQFNFDRQQAEIDKLYHENEKKEVQNRQQYYLILGISIILFLTAVLAYFLYMSDKQKKKTNRLLANQKEEITSQAERLKEANHKLVELDGFKRNLTGMIVHDLKNPLNALLNIAPKNITYYYQQVKNYSNQMLTLVLNILDVQKFEDTNIKLNTTKINFNDILHEACEQIDFMKNEKNIHIQLENTVQNFVILDYEIILRVLVNLLTNAIKYSPNNTNIEIKIYKQDQELRCSVRDFGKGIPEDKLTLIFEKFVQLDNDIKKTYRSTGLGLTYCKMAVEAHNGKIWAESKDGQGAKFIFTLPLTIEQHTLPTPENTTSETFFQNLTKEDKKMLLDYYESLKKIEVYYTSDIEKVLQKIDFNQSENLKNWETELRKAIRNSNQILYNTLLEKIKENT